LKWRADAVGSETVCCHGFHPQSQSERLAIKTKRDQSSGLFGLRRSMWSRGHTFPGLPVFPWPHSRGVPPTSFISLVNSQWPHLVQWPLICMRGELLAGASRVTNSVTFQRARVYCGCQEAGGIREENTPAHLPQKPNESRLVFGLSRCWCDTIQSFFLGGGLRMKLCHRLQPPCGSTESLGAIPRRDISI